MKRSRVSRPMVVLLAAALLLSDLLAAVPPAAEQVTPANAALGLFRVINAINRRNRIYQAGRVASRTSTPTTTRCATRPAAS